MSTMGKLPFLTKILHRLIGVGSIHVPYNWVYATSGARTAAKGFISSDIGKLAFQTSDNSLWILTAVTPTWTAVGGTGSSGREVLSAARTYYVRTDGSDANNGLGDTAAGAFLSIQAAINAVCFNLDMQGYQVTIQVRDGTYTGGITLLPYVGTLYPIITGNSVTPTNVVVNVAGNCISHRNKSMWEVDYCKLISTNNGIVSTGGGTLYYKGIDFGACTSSHITCSNYGVVANLANYTISGGAPTHCSITEGGEVSLGSTITISGTPAFSVAFCYQRTVGILVSLATFSGAATGVRYNQSLNAVIFVNGAGTTYLPGNSAGVTATGAQYA